MLLRDALTDMMTMTRGLRRLSDALWPEFGLGASAAMPVDVFETRDEVVVQAYLPGFRREDVQVELDQGQLSIRAERAMPKREDVSWWYVEAPYGTFQRTIQLGPAIDADKIEAAWQDGVLTLRLPKAEQARPRLIPIHTANPPALEGPEAKAS